MDDSTPYVTAFLMSVLMALVSAAAMGFMYSFMINTCR